jgi:5-methylcytosine-specific restriction endonuclease McrA
MEGTVGIYAKANAPRNSNKPLEDQDQSHCKKSAMSEVTTRELEQLIEKQAYRCAISGILLTPDSASLDHKTPVAKGGSNRIDNLQWLDSRVNKCKHTLSNDEFLQMCRSVVAHMESVG